MSWFMGMYTELDRDVTETFCRKMRAESLQKLTVSSMNELDIEVKTSVLRIAIIMIETSGSLTNVDLSENDLTTE